MNEGIELIIFDCDGVLIDSEGISSRVETEELRRCGCSITVETYLEGALGLAEEEEIWNRIAAENGIRLPSDFAETVRGRVTEAFEKELIPIPGVSEVLSKLDTPSCIASSSSPDRLKKCLALTGLTEFFTNNVFSAAEVSRGKPHPDLFLHAASRMGADPPRCLVVEDSPAGVQGARAANMTVLGFLGATHQIPGLPGKLIASGSTALFKDMHEFPAILGKIQSTRE